MYACMCVCKSNVCMQLSQASKGPWPCEKDSLVNQVETRALAQIRYDEYAEPAGFCQPSPRTCQRQRRLSTKRTNMTTTTPSKLTATSIASCRAGAVICRALDVWVETYAHIHVIVWAYMCIYVYMYTHSINTIIFYVHICTRQHMYAKHLQALSSVRSIQTWTRLAARMDDV